MKNICPQTRNCLPFLFLVFAVACSEGTQEFAPSPADIEANNRGVGLMGHFDYPAAHDVFRELADNNPDWLDAWVNLAIATLNRQQDGDEDKALEIVSRVLARDPDHPRAHYVRGLLLLYRGAMAEAEPHFRTVVEGDPADAHAAYFLAQSLSQQSKPEDAITYYRQAVERDPYLLSAYYGAFQALQLLDRAEEAGEMLGVYQKLGKNPRARLVEFRYTRMGRKGEVWAIGRSDPVTAPAPTGTIFDPRRDIDPGLARGRVLTGPIGMTTMDINGDGAQDLFIPGFRNPDETSPTDTLNAVLLGREKGKFALHADHELTGISLVNAAAWGDFDNDGLVDVYLLRRGPNQLWRQISAGEWRNVSETTATDGGDFDSLDGAFFDADHDGDLDIFVINGDGPNELFNNNLDGTFWPLAVSAAIAGNGGSSRAVVPADIDGDGDVDIIVLNANSPHEIYQNDRLWAYRTLSGFDQFATTPMAAVVAGDTDADGRSNIVGLSPDGILRQWRPDLSGDWRVTAQYELGPSEVGATGPRLALADVTGTGRLDLIVGWGNSWSVFRLAEDAFEPVFAPNEGPDLAAWIPVVVDAGDGPAVVGVSGDGKLSIWSPGPGRFPFLSLVFSGKESDADSMRSNASGIGTSIALRVGSRWTAARTFQSHSGPGQSLQPISIGLGGATHADFVAIDWPDGVFQTELELAAGTLHSISETQRQLSSCPVVFAWNGETYAFVTDILGVGGVGYAVGPGEYSTPRPWENLLMPHGFLKPKDGAYHVKVTEPMEESAYLDAARLVVYDVPPSWHMVLDERMGINGPSVTGEAIFYREEQLPKTAVTGHGEDVSDAISEADLFAAPVGERDPRFIGRLSEPQVVTLEFAGAIDGRDAILIMDGWVEYPYSQTNFAAWQAGATFHPPTLEAKGADAVWRIINYQFGYPAGMPRRATLPLENLPPGTTALRLTTNQKIYWDRLAVAYREPTPDFRRHTLPLRSASMGKAGFPLRSSNAQRVPDYDFERRQPFWDTRYQEGFYTRFGPVTELVRDVDDAVAIIGPGDEVHLAFTDSAPPLTTGWRRYFVLEANGWAKDMDYFTRDGTTVGPLPTSGKPMDRRAVLHARYNTRFLGGR